MNDISLNVIASQREKEEQFWKKQIPIGEIVSDLLWAKNVNSQEEGQILTYETRISTKVSEDVMKMCKSKHENVHVVLLSILKILLHRYSANSETVIFTPLYKGLKKGNINNVIPICTSVDKDIKVVELVPQVKNNLVQAIKHQNYPVQNLWEEIRTGESATSRIQLIYEPVQSIVECNLDIADIHFIFDYDNDGFSLKINHPQNYDQTLIENVGKHFVNLISSFQEVKEVLIKDLEFITLSEKEKIRNTFNQTEKFFQRDKSILHYIHEHSIKQSDKVAIADAEREVTYGELVVNVRKISTYLQSLELDLNKPIGVLLERGVEMTEVILAIWKMGGIYIPLDVKYPKKRIETLLKDSGAYLVSKSEHVLNHLDSNDTILIDEIAGSPEVDGSFTFEYDPNSLAYIIYTSGSTGSPKGAMLEHFGMMNHLEAKITDLEISVDSVVFQTASHTFDISVWQLFIALVKGGKTVICSNEIVLNPELLSNLLIVEKATHIQVVPSYLVAFLEFLNARKLTFENLEYLISAGEELRAHLVQQWFELYPHIKILNAYGPTEASIDILHHLLTSVPKHFVPIGKPIQNTSIYIMDDQMNDCPIGVKGEICVSGYGVGRGYLNNRAKTEEVFLTNPFDTTFGDHLYKTGDIGRWLPDGTIQFHGRKDHQVKVRGYRIELGEIEANLLSHKEVKEAVVTLAKNDNGTNYISAFIICAGQIESNELASYLSQFLPEYMVPAVFTFLDEFPKLLSGKINRKALPEPHFESKREKKQAVGEIETIMVDVWIGVLGIKGIGTNENFFKLGGDSIKAIQLSARMLTKNIKVTIQDIFEYPTISELSKQAKLSYRKSSQEVVKGEVEMLPIQQLFFRRNNILNHFNQAIMLSFEEMITSKEVLEIASKLQEHHDALRMTYIMGEKGVKQYNAGLDHLVSVEEYDLREQQDEKTSLEEVCNSIQASIDISKGPLMKMATIHMNSGSRLLIVVHHLVIDGVSWRILLEDVQTLHKQFEQNLTLELPEKTDSFRFWTDKLNKYVESDSFEIARKYWTGQREIEVLPITKDNYEGSNKVKDIDKYSFTLNKTMTTNLLTKANESYGTKVQELLLIALAHTFKICYDNDNLSVHLEGHGREEIGGDVNVSRTVGWFTTLFPVILQPQNDDLSLMIKNNKELLRAIPNNGLDYGFLDYWKENEQDLDIVFNYLGQFDTDFDKDDFGRSNESFGNTVDPEMERGHALEIIGLVSEEQLLMQISFSKNQFKEESISTLATTYEKCLSDLIAHCVDTKFQYLTPSDLTYTGLSINELEELSDNYDIQDVFSLSPTQEGILYHTLLEPSSSNYFVQFSYQLEGELNLTYIEESFETIIERYDNLRTTFIYEHYKRPLQVVLKHRSGGFEFNNIIEEVNSGNKEHILKEYRIGDRQRNFDIKEDILIRLTVLKIAEKQYVFNWSFHHILMDGWCTSVLMKEFIHIYYKKVNAEKVLLPVPKQYVEYIKWLENQNREQAREYWTEYLKTFEQATSLPLRKSVTETEQVIEERIATVGKATTRKLQQLSSDAGVTLNTVIQAAWSIVLATYNNTNDVVFGSVVSGRPAEVEGIEAMIGLFINTIPVRVKYDTETVFELLEKMQREALQSVKYDFYPLAKIQSGSKVGNKLIEHIFVFENYPIADEIESGWNNSSTKQATFTVNDISIFEHTNYDLSIIVGPGEDILLKFQYNNEKIEDSSITALQDTLCQVLEQLSSRGNIPVSDIEVVSESEKEKLDSFNCTERDYPLHRTIYEIFAEQVNKNKNRPAVISEGQQISYQELEQRADQLANQLLKSGYAGTNKIIGIYLDRSVDYVVAILGIIKSGSAYLPISKFLPESRIKYILENSACECVISNSAHSEKVGSMCDVIIPSKIDKDEHLRNKVETTISPADLLYIIYTSGSTGNPKGVRVTHRNIVNLIYGLNDSMFSNYDEPIKFALVSPFDFDASIQHLFGALLFGHTLYVAPEESRADGYQLMDFYQNNNIEISDGTPTHLRMCLESKKEFSSSLKHFLFAGEQLPKNLAEKFFEKNCTAKISNYYGPTETAVDTTFYDINQNELDKFDTVPIGKPLPNQSVAILNNKLRHLPIGGIGEICIAGLGVSNGYHNQSELTDQYFVNDPSGKEGKIYKTGDLGRWLPDGNIEYLGRIDKQVKIRGFRIEPGEIENQLMKIDGIKEAVVVVSEESGSSKLIVFYTADLEFKGAELRSALEMKLPYYMIPSFFIKVEAIPLTSNKKVDYKALSNHNINFEKNSNFIAPQNSVEIQLVDLWRKVLNIDNIGINDNFFEVGGNSLDLVRVYGLMKNEMNFKEALVKLVQFPSVRMMAEYITTDIETVESKPELKKVNKSKKMKMARRSSIKQSMNGEGLKE